jgi:hypothetical protein
MFLLFCRSFSLLWTYILSAFLFILFWYGGRVHIRSVQGYARSVRAIADQLTIFLVI